MNLIRSHICLAVGCTGDVGQHFLSDVSGFHVHGYDAENLLHALSCYCLPYDDDDSVTIPILKTFSDRSRIFDSFGPIFRCGKQLYPLPRDI